LVIFNRNSESDRVKCPYYGLPNDIVIYAVGFNLACCLLQIAVMYGNPEVTSGGLALKFFASLRLDIRNAGKIKSVSF